MRDQFADEVRLWFAGWAFVVAHFLVQFFVPAGTSPFPETLRCSSLLLAAIFFIWAATARRPTWRGFQVVSVLAAPQIGYAALAAYGVTAAAPYFATVGIGLALLPFFAKSFVRSPRSRGILYAAALALAGSIVVVTRYDHDASDTLINLLSFDFLLAGAFYARRFRRASAGVVVTVLGFIAWAAVFPVGQLLAVLLPHVHIDGTAWNVPKYVVGIGIIVTLLEEQIALVHHLALHDSLTGLANRRFLETVLGDAIARATRERGQIGVVAIDLDNFKEINDSLGHDLGDAVLQAVALRLEQSLPGAATCGRIGGDEFLVVLPRLGGREALQSLARDVLGTFDQAFRIDGRDLRIGASAGTAMWPTDARDAAGLLAISDRWMYAMKRAHRLSAMPTGT